MNDIDFAVRVDYVVVVERAMRIENETLNRRIILIEPESANIEKASAVDEEETSHLIYRNIRKC